MILGLDRAVKVGAPISRSPPSGLAARALTHPAAGVGSSLSAGRYGSPAMYSDVVVREKTFDELSSLELYRILRLRIDVFVVEQACAFCDLDGRDPEPTARHLWLEEDGRVVAYARILDGDRTTEVGRIVTPAERRGEGYGARILREALARTVGPVAVGAQSRLHDWYAHFGFVACGPEYVEDGIPHLPMRLDR